MVVVDWEPQLSGRTILLTMPPMSATSHRLMDISILVLVGMEEEGWALLMSSLEASVMALPPPLPAQMPHPGTGRGLHQPKVPSQFLAAK